MNKLDQDTQRKILVKSICLEMITKDIYNTLNNCNKDKLEEQTRIIKELVDIIKCTECFR